MEDALEQIIDYRGKTPKKSDSGIPTLSAKSVKNNHIDYVITYHLMSTTGLWYVVFQRLEMYF
mgnify:CR=1 FL=1